MNRYTKFREQMEPYAKRAAAALKMPFEVILGQWSWESDEGTSELANRANNYGGIKWVPKSVAAGKYTIGSNVYAKYAHLNQFTDDYIRVINNGYYEKVKDATTIEGTMAAIGASPYAESPYKDASGRAGMGLVGLIKEMGLRISGAENVPGAVSAVPNVETMGTSDLKMYAAIGVGVLGLAALGAFFNKD